ncbi:unnamed protein product [Strongylus vulgaris]|uniref:Uncharacterized protein n=1 Tax=Strongylus vulgaris TaxID=40348 RepID=A0A3P7IXK4_STRVU|nr:unnamed protein product [Strongylus vulgaris]
MNLTDRCWVEGCLSLTGPTPANYCSLKICKFVVIRDIVHPVCGADLAMCKRYRPPGLWGRSGHVQTVAYGLLGHASLRRTFDRRAVLRLSDGTTVTYDIFEPTIKHKSGLDLTLALTPGIANSSESNYIRTCVHYAQERGLGYISFSFQILG